MLLCNGAHAANLHPERDGGGLWLVLVCRVETADAVKVWPAHWLRWSTARTARSDCAESTGDRTSEVGRLCKARLSRLCAASTVCGIGGYCGFGICLINGLVGFPNAGKVAFPCRREVVVPAQIGSHFRFRLLLAGHQLLLFFLEAVRKFCQSL
jgi:hypothetical protein